MTGYFFAMTTEDEKLWRHVTQSVKPLGVKTARKPKPQPPAQKPVVHATRKPEKSFTLPVVPLPKPLYDGATDRKLARGTLPVEAKLDLHGMTQDKAYAALRRFVARCEKQGKRTLLVITGKGLRTGGGVLKRMLPLWLEETDMRRKIVTLRAARPEDGGDGAFYIRLKKAAD
jgi:DNA-nicking Smr family endonuclease